MSKKSTCGNPACCVSTGICGSFTFGSGGLDDCGYWEVPCPECARAYEAQHPGAFAWPRKRILWFDHCEYFAEDFMYSGGVPVVPDLRAKPIAEYGFSSPPYWEKKGLTR